MLEAKKIVEQLIDKEYEKDLAIKSHRVLYDSFKKPTHVIFYSVPFEESCEDKRLKIIEV